MAANPNNVLRISAASTNITTSAYVQLSASTPIGTTQIAFSNNTSSTIILAVGAAGSEVQLIACAPAAQVVAYVGLNIIPEGSRHSLIAADATASTGYVVVSLLP